jgi:heme/copper-type cytochrome/quinol oxidase subunit 2
MQKTFTRATAPVLVVGLLALLAVGLVSTYTTNRGVAGQGTVSNAIQLSAKLVGSDFKWVNSTNGAISPTLNFKVNTNHIIKFQNPTDTKHQLIIDLNGKQLATSGDIAPGSSGQVSFKPNMIGTFGYHCLYHPDTMNGIIQVQASTPGGNPTAGNTTSSSSAMPKSTTSPPPTTTTGPNY